jgi:hypothetical protein
MRRLYFSALSALLPVLCFSLYAETDFDNSVSLEAKRFAYRPNRDNGSHNLDNAFIRVESGFKGTAETGVSGCVQARFVALMGQSSPSPEFSIELLQANASIPVSSLTLTIGRWKETYSHMSYFGRYLFGPDSGSLSSVTGPGSGSSDAQEGTVLDGVRLYAPLLKQYNTTFELALLPVSYDISRLYVMLMAKSSPVDFLSVSLGTDLQIMEPGDEQQMHRAALSLSYKIIDKITLTAEYGIADLDRFKDDSWVAAGLELPTLGLLDLLKFEVEFKNTRLGTDSSADLAIACIVRKKISHLQFDLIAGTDPHYFKSTKFTHTGICLRATADF